MTRNRLHAAASLTGMRALRDDRFLGRLRRRRWRRALVLAVGALWLLTVVAMTRPVRAEAASLWIAGVLLTTLALTSLTLATRNVGNTIDAFADERDRAVRDRAHRLAYWILGAPVGALLGLTFGYVAGAVEDGGTLVLTGAHLWSFGAVVFSGMLLYAALPAVIIGWTEPDPVADEFDA